MSELIDLKPLQNLMATAGLSDLGPGPRPRVQPEAALEEPLRRLRNDSPLSAESWDLIRSLVLLWHDHLDAAHTIAQAIDSADGSYVHGILHRREPDYGNAKYWFRRVGQHPCFARLTAQASDLLRATPVADLEARLMPRGAWDPCAFIDACEKAAGRGIQAVEFEILLEHLVRPGAE